MLIGHNKSFASTSRTLAISTGIADDFTKIAITLSKIEYFYIYIAMKRQIHQIIYSGIEKQILRTLISV